MLGKKIIITFAASFVLNLVWENLHSLLYTHYQGGEITQLILLRATLIDAILITAVCLPFFVIPHLKNTGWLIVPVNVALAIVIELRALSAGRWAYNELMPIVPVLNVGLTPTIQLAILGYISYLLAVKLSAK